jgi:hypothetical protein
VDTHPPRRRGNAYPRAAQAAGLLALLVIILGRTAMATPSAAASPSVGNRFIGVEKCKNCHKTAENGNQYGKWTKTWHPGAFETLAGDDAKALAKLRGVDDPQKADACLKCHTTGYGAPADEIAKGFKPELGVQCESCHGPGEAHMKARIAAAAKGEGAATVMADGEINRKPNMDTCLKCHNPESPSYRPFCFKEMHALMVHLNPRKPRSEAEMAALMNPFGCTDTECKCPKPAGASDAASQPAGAGEQPKGG